MKFSKFFSTVMRMNDLFNRTIDYLRISVTDRCNLRCLYCMPEEGVNNLKHSDVLRYEEIAEIAAVSAAMGVSKIRITGGEPLVRPGVTELVRMIKAVDGISDISMDDQRNRSCGLCSRACFSRFEPDKYQP